MPQTEKVLVLSTGHLPPWFPKVATTASLRETFSNDGGLSKIDRRISSLWILDYEYGWMVHVYDPLSDRVPSELAAPFTYAFDRGCQWIRFDCDADTISDLPIYDW